MTDPSASITRCPQAGTPEPGCPPHAGATVARTFAVRATVPLICPELSGQRIWVNSRCELPFYVFLVRLSRAPVLKPGVPTL